jgi:hypothetical protein
MKTRDFGCVARFSRTFGHQHLQAGIVRTRSHPLGDLPAATESLGGRDPMAAVPTPQTIAATARHGLAARAGGDLETSFGYQAVTDLRKYSEAQTVMAHPDGIRFFDSGKFLIRRRS